MVAALHYFTLHSVPPGRSSSVTPISASALRMRSAVAKSFFLRASARSSIKQLHQLADQVVAAGGFFFAAACGTGPSVPASSRSTIVPRRSDVELFRRRAWPGSSSFSSSTNLLSSRTRSNSDADAAAGVEIVVHRFEEAVALLGDGRQAADSSPGSKSPCCPRRRGVRAS